MVLFAKHTPPQGAFAEGVGQGRRQRVLAESINYRRKLFISTASVDYNNPSPAIANDSQNSIHCCWRITIVYKLNKNRVTNDSIARL
jgi:hypothetical protein